MFCAEQGHWHLGTKARSHPYDQWRWRLQLALECRAWHPKHPGCAGHKVPVDQGFHRVRGSCERAGHHIDGLPGYATDYDHKMWPVNCMHIGDAHFKLTAQTTARLQLVLPITSGAQCQSQVSLPYFHDDIDVTDGGAEGSLKQKS